MLSAFSRSGYLPNYVFEQHGEWDLCDIVPQTAPSDKTRCFAESLPKGFTNLIDFELDIEGEINDNREVDAPDLTWWLEVCARTFCALSGGVLL